MRVLITGASGFIGTHLANSLSKNENITEIHRVSRNLKCKSGYDYQADLTDTSKVKILLRHICPDVIFHLAGNPIIKPDEDNPTQIIQDNVTATQNLCHYAVPGSRFIFASSIVVYGDKTVKCKETECCRPTSMYGATKLASEGIIHAYHKQGHIKGTSLRLCATVGSGTTHGILHDFVRKLRSDSDELEVFGNHPGTRKPFCYIGDVVKAFELMLNVDVNSVYNVVPDNSITVEDVTGAVMAQLNIIKPLKWLGSKSTWKGDNSVLWCDNQRLKYRGWELDYPCSQHAIMQAVKDILDEPNR